MKKITAYKTTDGSIFEEEAEAVRHESEGVIRANISKLFREMEKENCIGSDSIDDIVDFVVYNRQQFRNALRGDVYI